MSRDHAYSGPRKSHVSPGTGRFANGAVFRGDDGKLYLRLDWNKRYIILAAISTLHGLAFKLRDSENLLGRGEEREAHRTLRRCAVVDVHRYGGSAPLSEELPFVYFSMNHAVHEIRSGIERMASFTSA